MSYNSFNELAKQIYNNNVEVGWWKKDESGKVIDRNPGELVALMHSELSEMLEAFRKNLMDSHLPHRKGIEVELADLFIRGMDLAGHYNLDIDGAIAEKLAYNKTRADHKLENRNKEGGKAF